MFQPNFNMKNVEIKAKIDDLVGLIEKAKLLSGSQGEIIKQHDTFYNVPEGRFKLRRFESGRGELIFYERSDVEGPKLCSYLKTDLPEYSTEGLGCMLTRVLGVKTVVKKTRQLFLVGHTRIHIDYVEGLGNFMELEVVLRDEQTAEEGEVIANNLMKELNIKKEDLIIGAYADLLVAE